VSVLSHHYPAGPNATKVGLLYTHAPCLSLRVVVFQPPPVSVLPAFLVVVRQLHIRPLSARPYLIASTNTTEKPGKTRPDSLVITCPCMVAACKRTLREALLPPIYWNIPILLQNGIIYLPISPRCLPAYSQHYARRKSLCRHSTKTRTHGVLFLSSHTGGTLMQATPQPPARTTNNRFVQFHSLSQRTRTPCKPLF
jgi:hypothetical protein